jgi:hypothetical protein
MNKRYFIQCFVILITCVFLISLLMIYSYKNKFNSSKVEGFNTDTDTTTTTTIPITKNDINEINKLSDNLKKLHDIKMYNYIDYDINIDDYANELKLSKDIFNFEDEKFNIDFYQKLQNDEINDLNDKYSILKTELNNLNLKKKNKTNKKIKHIISGTIFHIYGYNNNYNNSFNIITNKDTSICLEYKAIDPEYINTSPVSKQINNINTISCDYGDLNNNNLSNIVKLNIQNQKFIAVKINNNKDFNDNLHEYYEIYKIPADTTIDNNMDFTNTLNNYPYYIIKPFNNSNNMCLTIKNRMMSIEPCDGSDSQKFMFID